MNRMQKIISCMFLLCIEMVFFAEPVRDQSNAQEKEQRATQAQQKKQKAKPVLTADKAPAAHKKIAPKELLQKAVVAPKEAPEESLQTNQLIHNFIDSVGMIRGTCESSLGKERARPANHKKMVEKAHLEYKKLYDHFDKYNLKISKQENDKIKKEVEKLFNCKNIKNMVWHGHVDEKDNQVSKTQPLEKISSVKSS